MLKNTVRILENRSILINQNKNKRIKNKKKTPKKTKTWERNSTHMNESKDSTPKILLPPERVPMPR